MNAKTINIIGLILAMAGSFIWFFVGFPQPSFEEDDLLKLELPGSEARAEAARKQKARYACISKIGLALIFVGFVLQLIAASKSN